MLNCGIISTKNSQGVGVDYQNLLDELGLEYKTSGSEALTHCPHCFHHNPKLSINLETGFYQCFVCGEVGGFNKLKKTLSEAPPPSLSSGVPSRSVGNSLAAERIDWASDIPSNYLKSRGITREYTLGLDGDSIVFPYHDMDNRLVGLKFKPIRGSGSYRMEGTHPGAYTPDLGRFHTSDEVVIVEGEIDCLSVLEYTVGSRVTALATTGATNHKCVNLLSRFKTIYIWLDNDEAGKKQTPILAQKIHEAHPEAIVRLIKAPMAIKDPNEYLVAGYSQEEFQSLLQSSEYFANKPLSRNAASYVDGMFSYLTDKTKAQGMPTLLPGLDKMLGGGKRLGEITAWHAAAKVGKNSLWHQLMYFWLQAGIPIGYASRELSPDTEVLPNLLSIHYGVNMWKEVAKVSKEEIVATTGTWPVYFADGYGVFDIDDLKKWIVELKKQGVQHFWIDHMHFCIHDSENPKEIAMFARELKSLAKSENVHIDIIIQPKYLTDNMKMGLNSLRGGAAIGQAIDNLFVLERAQIVGEENVSKLSLEVARHKLARPGKEIYLKYYPESTRIEEIKLEDNLEEIVPQIVKKDWSIK